MTQRATRVGNSKQNRTEVCVKRYDMLGKRVAGSIPTQGHFRVGFTQVGKRSIILPGG